MQSPSSSASSRSQSIFFSGSAQDAIELCRREKKLLVVFLHGLCDGESIRADAAVHHALHSYNSVLALRLYDDLNNTDPLAHEDAKFFREIFPSVKSLPFLMILNSAGDPVAELEGYEVADQVEKSLVEASNNLSNRQGGSSVHSHRSESVGPSKSLESNQSSTFNTSFPAFPAFPTWNTRSAMPSRPTSATQSPSQTPPLSPRFQSSFGQGFPSRHSGHSKPSFSSKPASQSQSPAMSPGHSTWKFGGVQNQNPADPSLESRHSGFSDFGRRPVNSSSSSSNVGSMGGAIAPFPFSAPQMMGQESSLISNFPQSETISMADAIIQASSQAAAAAAGDAFGQSQQSQQTTTILQSPSSYSSQPLDPQGSTPQTNFWPTATRGFPSGNDGPRESQPGSTAKPANLEMEQSQTSHASQLHGSQSLGGFGLSSLDSKLPMPTKPYSFDTSQNQSQATGNSENITPDAPQSLNKQEHFSLTASRPSGQQQDLRVLSVRTAPPSASKATEPREQHRKYDVPIERIDELPADTESDKRHREPVPEAKPLVEFEEDDEEEETEIGGSTLPNGHSVGEMKPEQAEPQMRIDLIPHEGNSEVEQNQLPSSASGQDLRPTKAHPVDLGADQSTDSAAAQEPSRSAPAEKVDESSEGEPLTAKDVNEPVRNKSEPSTSAAAIAEHVKEPSRGGQTPAGPATPPIAPAARPTDVLEKYRRSREISPAKELADLEALPMQEVKSSQTSQAAGPSQESQQISSPQSSLTLPYYGSQRLSYASSQGSQGSLPSTPGRRRTDSQTHVQSPREGYFSNSSSPRSPATLANGVTGTAHAPENAAQLLLGLSRRPASQSPSSDPSMTAKTQKKPPTFSRDHFAIRHDGSPPISAFQPASLRGSFDDLGNEEASAPETDKAERIRSADADGLPSFRHMTGYQQTDQPGGKTDQKQLEHRIAEAHGPADQYANPYEPRTPRSHAARHVFSSMGSGNADSHGRPKSRSPRRSGSIRRKGSSKEHEGRSIDPAGFKGFDTASHRHTSPITSPRALEDQAQIFKPSDAKYKDLNEHKAGTEQHEIEMESPEKKARLEQMDLIPLPDRTHESAEPKASPAEVAVARAGMMTASVGSLQVYLGALLVILLGFLSGLFSLGAKQLVQVTPASVKEAITPPFQLISHQILPKTPEQEHDDAPEAGGEAARPAAEVPQTRE